MMSKLITHNRLYLQFFSKFFSIYFIFILESSGAGWSFWIPKTSCFAAAAQIVKLWLDTAIVFITSLFFVFDDSAFCFCFSKFYFGSRKIFLERFIKLFEVPSNGVQQQQTVTIASAAGWAKNTTDKKYFVPTFTKMRKTLLGVFILLSQLLAIEVIVVTTFFIYTLLNILTKFSCKRYFNLAL